ncbi:hypothetical protein [Phaeobacter porticola]|uniref:hypothetical protein n=1 Tax=Phaeobacter porticola TaxID=1844006 RepID=UPI0009300052|nr:hypothetical protein [Phaeobacter porticola]
MRPKPPIIQPAAFVEVGSLSDFAAYALNIGSLTSNGSVSSDPLQNHGFGEIGEWPVSFIPPQWHCRMGIGRL